MEERKLGKIVKAEFGRDKDYPYLFGLMLEFKLVDGWVSDGGKFLVNLSDECEWVDLSQRANTIMIKMDYVYRLLEEANCHYISELKNIPVEVTIEDGLFKSFRILTEVL